MEVPSLQLPAWLLASNDSPAVQLITCYMIGQLHAVGTIILMGPDPIFFVV